MSNWERLKDSLGKGASRKRKNSTPFVPDSKKSKSINLNRAFSLNQVSRAEIQRVEPVETQESEVDVHREKTHVVAMDCEFVGVGPGGRRSALARVSVVNFHGFPIYDSFVRPKERVVDYRTKYSGIRAKDLKSDKCKPFDVVVREVGALIRDKTVVGHALKHDFAALMFPHPKNQIRDTAYYKFFCPSRPRSLKDLVKEFLDRDIQGGEHCSVEDAKAALDLYKLRRKQWESEIANTVRREKKQRRDSGRKFG